MDDIRQLEHLTLATSPALAEQPYDGWVLRASGTDTRRANSITQLESGSVALADKIAHAESWYRQQQQPTLFRITPLSAPELDGMLDARGYRREGDTHIMTLDLGGATGSQRAGDGFVVQRSQEEGIADLHRLKGSSDALMQQDLRRQARWQAAQTYVAVEHQGELVSCGMARCLDNCLGIFNMRTADNARGRGYAAQVVEALLDWGRAQGAAKAFLQVDQANLPALRLYRGYGFLPRYDYWYRVQP